MWLALFSVLFTVGDELGAWPTLTPGSFRNLDLVAGLIAGLLLLIVFLTPARRSQSRIVDRVPLG